MSTGPLRGEESVAHLLDFGLRPLAMPCGPPRALGGRGPRWIRGHRSYPRRTVRNPIREACNLSVLFLKYLLSAAGAAPYQEDTMRILTTGSFAAAAVLATATFITPVAPGAPFGSIVVFGTSLSDPGNAFALGEARTLRPTTCSTRSWYPAYRTRTAAIISATARPGSNSLPGLAVLRAASDRPSTTETHRPPTSPSAPRAHGRTA